MKKPLHFTLALALLFPFLTSPTHAQTAVPATSAAPTGTSTAAATESDEDDGSENYGDYVKAFNSVNSMFYGSVKGMGPLLESYKSQRLGSRSGGGREPILYLNTSMLRNSVAALQEAAKVKGATGEYAKLDQIGQRMLTNGLQLLKTATGLESYFRSKKFQDDDFAFGREQDAGLIRMWQQFIQDHDVMDGQLEVIQRAHRISAIAQHRKQGDNLSAATAEVMLHSSDLLNLFGGTEDLRNAEKMKLADALVTKLDQSAAEMRNEMDSRGINATRSYNSVYEYMIQFLGNYRDFKRSGSDGKLKSMVEYYNHAVGSYGRLSR